MRSSQRSRRWLGWSIPVALTIVAFTADRIRLDNPQSGFGGPEAALLTLAALFFALAVLDARWHWTPRILLAAIACYVSLLLCDFAVVIATPSLRRTHALVRPHHPVAGLKGLNVPDEAIGFKLAPNWQGSWEDGIVNVQYRTNSKGHRDDEPDESGRQRLLLIGDSFTFGVLLGEAETVDKQIEQLTGHEMTAYNTGVAGAGPPMIFEFLRRSSWFEGSDVVYLFFNNDLRDDNLVPDAQTVVQGYLVPQYDPESGRRYSLRELEKKVKEKLASPKGTSLGQELRKTVKLYHLRKLVGAVSTSPTLVNGDESKFRASNVQDAITHTEAMRSVSHNRDMRFHVVIIPTKAEAAAKRYSGPTEAFVAELRQRGFNTIELLDEVTSEHYFTHDGHFNAQGARQTASTIVETLRR